VAKISLAKDFYESMDLLEKDSRYNLVILDLRMPGMNGTDGFVKIRDTYPDVPIALMSGVAEPADVCKVLDLGAVGYFPKTLSGKALLSAIEQVLHGEIYIPEDHSTGGIMPSYYADKPKSSEGLPQIPSDIQLTPREKDVLGFLVEGASNKEIARELDLQVVTVKLHVRGICRKLQVQNRTQAALVARDLGVQINKRQSVQR
jgi:DNA-binding NarL/FixJ family response regulator